MRVVLLVLAVLSSAASCTCGGCASKSSPSPLAQALAGATDAGVVLVATTPEVPTAKPVVPEATDAGELPPEVQEGSPPEAEILSAYLADCHATIEVSYEDIDGPQKKADCEALTFDQNCAPDRFGCYDGMEKCRTGCALPCNDCQSRCGATCDGCLGTCDGGDCRRTCAVERAECRKSCLYEVQRCRADACSREYERCGEDVAKRTAAQCPDCEAIRTCGEKRMNERKPMDDCLTPGNAKECLEWCAPWE